MNIAQFALEKRVLMYLLMVVLLAGGYTGFMNLGRLEDPAFTISDVQIITSYPGANAIEVEQEVSEILENVIQKIKQIDRVSSESSKGRSIITATYQAGFSSEEYRQLYDELRKKINDAQGLLPPGAGQSIVNDDFGDVYGIFYAVTGLGFSERELFQFSEQLQKELVLVPGIAKVELWGMPREIIYVEIPSSRMDEMNLSSDTLASLIGDQNQVVDAGDVNLGEERAIFAVTGDFSTVESIGNILIPSQDGGFTGDTQITLDNIAQIYRGYEEPLQKLMRYNGKRGIGLALSANTEENVVEIGKRVSKVIDSIKEQTPIGIEVETIFDQPSIVEQSVNNFLLSLVQSVAIVVALLLIFMGVQSGVIIGFMLLLIISGTLLFMYVFQITLQRISLGALIIAMGMLVDNSIVITEGILVRMNKGEDPAEASGKVVSQTIWPLFGATLVAIFAFAAVGMSPDGTGEFTKTLFYVVIISLLLSWFLAITINPLLCVKFMKAKISDNPEGVEEGKLTLKFKEILRWSLQRKGLVAMITVGFLVLAGFGFTTLAPGFFPASSQPQFMVDYLMPEGTDISTTSRDIAEIEEYLMDKEQFPDIQKVMTFIGSSPPRFQLTFAPEKPSSRLGQFLIEVENPDSIAYLIPEIQSYMDDRYPQAMSQAYRFMVGPGGKGVIQARFSGPDPTVLRQLSEQAKDIYRDTGNAVSIRDDWGERAKVSRVVLNETEAKRVGISRPQVNTALLQAFRGRTVGIFREDDKQIPVVFRPPGIERLETSSARDIKVWSPTLGTGIYLRQISHRFESVMEDTKIQRRNRRRTITVQCDPITGTGGQLYNEISPKVEAMELPPGYTLEWGGEAENSSKASEGIGQTFPLAFIAMFMTIIVLWNKVRQPIIIFLSIPLSIIGLVLGLMITGFPFSFMAIMGTLALFGMVIKNAIVMVDEIDLTWKNGGDRFQGIIDASATRVRPVMMAALSTVLGMVPLLADTFFQGMAVVIMGGLTVASVVTLIVTPVLYAIFFNVKESTLES